jgi:hypothetical protein
MGLHNVAESDRLHNYLFELIGAIYNRDQVSVECCAACYEGLSGAGYGGCQHAAHATISNRRRHLWGPQMEGCDVWTVKHEDYEMDVGGGQRMPGRKYFITDDTGKIIKATKGNPKILYFEYCDESEHKSICFSFWVNIDLKGSDPRGVSLDHGLNKTSLCDGQSPADAACFIANIVKDISQALNVYFTAVKRKDQSSSVVDHYKFLFKISAWKHWARIKDIINSEGLF